MLVRHAWASTWMDGIVALLRLITGLEEGQRRQNDTTRTGVDKSRDIRAGGQKLGHLNRRIRAGTSEQAGKSRDI